MLSGPGNVFPALLSASPSSMSVNGRLQDWQYLVPTPCNCNGVGVGIAMRLIDKKRRIAVIFPLR